MIPIRISLPSVRLGQLEAGSLLVQPVAGGLADEIASVTGKLASSLTVESVAELDSVRAVRAMFRAWGLDPSKYRPSAEALLRRLAQGKGLYQISNAVDIVNLGQVETGWPFGLYDRDRVEPPVTLRLGQRGETYEGIGRRVWHLDGRPVLADRQGPFGSPISDSTRTMVTPETRSLAAVIFAPAAAPDAAIETALSRLAARLERWAEAKQLQWEILRAEAGKIA